MTDTLSEFLIAKERTRYLKVALNISLVSNKKAGFFLLLSFCPKT